MNGIRQGAFRIFRFAGIDVFLHWSWFLIAAFEIQSRAGRYSSVAWNVLEYLALFLIVTMHEFGHALACRQVGGTANQILLWPFGGVAYVDPPPRPGANLWSLAAGPLANVVLLPILSVLFFMSRSLGWQETNPDVYRFLVAVLSIDLGLLIFNMLPVYPLDGGQILRSLLWFVIGRARSLLVATILGFVGIAGFIIYAFSRRSLWLGALSIFILMNCWAGLQRARLMLRMAKLPRRAGYACPSCKMVPLIGEFWVCGQCRRPFDTFQTQAVCPYCGARFSSTSCPDCGQSHPISKWIVSPPDPIA